jgi:hypothetical protein
LVCGVYGHVSPEFIKNDEFVCLIEVLGEPEVLLHEANAQRRRAVDWQLSHFHFFFPEHPINQTAAIAFALILGVDEEVEEAKGLEFVLVAQAIPEEEMAGTHFEEAKRGFAVVTQENVEFAIAVREGAEGCDDRREALSTRRGLAQFVDKKNKVLVWVSDLRGNYRCNVINGIRGEESHASHRHFRTISNLKAWLILTISKTIDPLSKRSRRRV